MNWIILKLVWQILFFIFFYTKIYASNFQKINSCWIWSINVSCAPSRIYICTWKLLSVRFYRFRIFILHFFNHFFNIRSFFSFLTILKDAFISAFNATSMCMCILKVLHYVSDFLFKTRHWRRWQVFIHRLFFLIHFLFSER